MASRKQQAGRIPLAPTTKAERDILQGYTEVEGTPFFFRHPTQGQLDTAVQLANDQVRQFRRDALDEYPELATAPADDSQTFANRLDELAGERYILAFTKRLARVCVVREDGKPVRLEQLDKTESAQVIAVLHEVSNQILDAKKSAAAPSGENV